MLTAIIDQLVGYGAWLVLLSAKATVLLLIALIAARLLRRQPARVHHALWTITFLALASLPVLGGMMPSLPLPGLNWTGELTRVIATTSAQPQWNFAEPGAAATLPPPDADVAARAVASGAGAVANAADEPRVEGTVTAAAAPQRTAAPRSFAWLRPLVAGLVALWIAGLAAVGALLGVALWRARCIASRAPLVRHHGWRASCAQVCDQLGIRRVVSLRVTDAVDTPMAGGVLAPFVLLPRAALSWSESHRRVVLQHELVHLRGLDPLRVVVARVAAALYWFHPLVWIAGREAVLARESACDETVVELGTRPSLYATVLLELAGSSDRSPIPAMVLPMIQRSLLETRLMSILNSDRPRGGRRILLATVVAMSLAALSVAAAAPQEEAPPKPRPEKVKPAPQAPALVKVEPAPAVAPAPPSGIRAEAAPAPEVAPVPSLAPSPAIAPQDEPAACVWDRGRSGSFSGSMSMTGNEGEGRVIEAVGRRDGHRMIRKSVDGVTICMREEGEVAFRDDMGAIESIGDGGRVLLATIDGDQVVEMEITGVAPESMTWSVNGAQRPVDAAAREWRESLMETLGHQWHISTLRGEASSLRGEISSMRGQLSSLRGEASSLRGEASSLRGQASGIRGAASSLHGEISSLRGEVSAMRGEVSSHRGQISALESQRHGASAQEAQELDRQIDEHRAMIEEVERQIENFDIEAKVEEYERRIEGLHADAEAEEFQAQARALEKGEQMVALQARILEYQEQSEREIEGLYLQIEALDLDTRIPEIEQQLELSIERLERALRGLR